MTMKLHSGFAYNQFDGMVKRFEVWALTRPLAAFGYESEVVASRLAQRLVELAFFPYVADCAGREKAGRQTLPGDDEVLTYEGVSIDQRNGRVRIGLLGFCRHLSLFFLHWAHVLLHIFRLTPGFSRKNFDRAGVLIGVGSEAIFNKEAREDRAFVRYCRNGPIKPLNQTHNLIVQASVAGDSEVDTAVTYYRYPFHALLSGVDLGIQGRARLLGRHMTIVVKLLVNCLDNPLLILLARDIAYLPMIRTLDARGKIETVFLSNSVYVSQPLYLRRNAERGFKVHMAWYAQNIFPFVYRSDGLVSHYPAYRHVSVDEHWLWTQYFSDYLANIGVSGLKHVVGPILWYLPESVNPRSSEVIKIAVFDVSPVREEVAVNCGLLRNYWNTDVMEKFINDIVEIAREVNRLVSKQVKILVKVKREYNQGHDRRYISLLELLNRKGIIEIVSHQINLYSFLSECDVSIVIPNSSPALVAAHLKRKTIYYDPTACLKANHETGQLIASTSDLTGLLDATLEAIAYNNRISD